MRLRVLLAATVLLAACSSGDGQAAPTTAVTAATTAVPATTVPPTSVPPTTVPPTTTPAPTCPTPAVAPGETTISVKTGDRTGTYIRHIPASYDGTKPMPLVVDLHGYGETAAIEKPFSGLAAYGDTNGFVTVLPQIDRQVPAWDAALGSPDLAFLGAVLGDAEETMCVDHQRVFVAGMSNGAIMASSIACQFADRVAAAATVAGLRDPAGCAPSRHIPVIAFHGTADQFVLYNGGYGPGAQSLPGQNGKGTLGSGGGLPTTGPSLPTIAAAWAGRDGCQTTPTEDHVAADVTLLRFSCPPGSEVELYRIENGGHTWPGSQLAGAVPNIIGHTTFSISANDLIWAFFTSHPLP